ncbi:hypothetical protein ABTY59_32050 [Streptomyces sp. NPDC096079]|uniref:hypothetical protein n=1 Tax=Streptomyces sp. NPDC096079 TaxID=3155820 RepID=UPI00331C7EA8
MTTAPNPMATFKAAADHAAAAARLVLPVIAATLHAQFPTGAHLVLSRSRSDEGGGLSLDSVRNADGTVLRNFDAGWASHVVVAANGSTWSQIVQPGMTPMPAAPSELASLWGDVDHRDPYALVGLIARLDAQVPHGLFDPMPEEHLTDEEFEEQEDGGPSLLWLPLAPLPTL